LNVFSGLAGFGHHRDFGLGIDYIAGVVAQAQRSVVGDAVFLFRANCVGGKGEGLKVECRLPEEDKVFLERLTVMAAPAK
jgi:hypothetical protein